MGQERTDASVVRAGKARVVQARRPRENAFGPKQQRRFLEHFAGSCNVTASCEHAEVKKSTVYKRRTHDPAFRQAWAAAQAQGYATLEAELVRRGLEFVGGVAPDEDSATTLAGMDARLILTILQQQQKSLGREPGDVHARRSDLAEATSRLAKLMKRMKLEIERDEAAARAAAADPAE